MTSRRDLLMASPALLAELEGQARRTRSSKDGGDARNGTTERPDEVVITDFGADPDLADNKDAIERAVRAAKQGAHTVVVPPGIFRFSTIDLGQNDGVDPRRFVLTGRGTLHSEHAGLAIVSGAGPFYDLVIDGPSFESVAGKGTKLLDGDRFRRLVIAPGTQIRNFDYVIFSTSYLQTVRMIGVIIRGGAGAVVKAAAAFDCVFSHNIIEFVTDGFVIDGDNDPALARCSIDDNLIEGIGGRAIALGACLATSVSNNYLENNTGGDIRLDAGTAPHKGLRVQGNAIQMSTEARAKNRYAITWGRSTALPTRAGGNYCNGNLHDTAGATALIDMNGDFAAGELYRGYNSRSMRNAPIGRAAFTDGLAQHFTWFDRTITLDPYNCEIRFSGRFADSREQRVLTFGARSPQQAPAAFDRKNWTQGTVVFNAMPQRGAAAAWICLQSGSPGAWGSIRLDD